MKSLASFLFLSGFLLAGCGNDQNQPAPTAKPATNAGAAPVSDANPLGAMINAQQRAVKTVDTASLNKAVQLFNVEEGRNPKTLDELVEKKLIGEIPPAPNGMKLDYNATTGEVKVVPK
jgi:hypothetical protein